MSKSVAGKKKAPQDSFKPPAADFFPSYPIHTLDSEYKADINKDEEEDNKCNKAFESSSTISGGLGTITCGHKITKGFRLIRKGESPLLFLHILLRRFPSDVKAKKRVIIYDLMKCFIGVGLIETVILNTYQVYFLLFCLLILYL